MQRTHPQAVDVLDGPSPQTRHQVLRVGYPRHLQLVHRLPGGGNTEVTFVRRWDGLRWCSRETEASLGFVPGCSRYNIGWFFLGFRPRRSLGLRHALTCTAAHVVQHARRGNASAKVHGQRQRTGFSFLVVPSK